MESYVQGALRKELLIAPFLERFKTTKQLLWKSLTDNFHPYFKQNA